jgi:hypothetical protein
MFQLIKVFGFKAYLWIKAALEIQRTTALAGSGPEMHDRVAITRLSRSIE